MPSAERSDTHTYGDHYGGDGRDLTWAPSEARRGIRRCPNGHKLAPMSVANGWDCALCLEEDGRAGRIAAGEAFRARITEAQATRFSDVTVRNARGRVIRIEPARTGGPELRYMSQNGRGHVVPGSGVLCDHGHELLDGVLFDPTGDSPNAAVCRLCRAQSVRDANAKKRAKKAASRGQ